MIKRLPSRNQRSKGVKVKHILQICLLLGVCFWLIYQIKHSHDKKKEFAENDTKMSTNVRTAGEVLKLGRKDLHPGKDEITKNEKHEEEEEDGNVEEDEENKHEHEEDEEGGENKHEMEEREGENKHEMGEQGDEENKHKTEEQEEDENRSEETEDEVRGEGDDEINENDQEKSEVRTDRDEEFMDEEKEKEEEGNEKENENSEDEEKEAHNKNQNTHEAREEHYKGDDASSAVAHDMHTTSTETEAVSLDNSDAKSDTSITEQESKLNYTEESIKNQNGSDLKVTEGELTNYTEGSIKNQNGSDLKVTEGELTKATYLNTTAGEESENRILPNPSDSSNLNTTVATNSDGHLEASANLTVITDVRYNSTQTGPVTSGSSELNGMVMLSESDHAQNATVDAKVTEDIKNVQTEGSEQTSNKASEEKLSDTNSTVSVGAENVDAVAGEAFNLRAGELEKSIKSAATNETEKNSRDSDVKENTDATLDKMPKINRDASEEDKSNGDTQTGETDETTNSSSENETSDAIEHDSIDSSDSHFHNDVTQVRTDLDTLPDTRTEGDNVDDNAAE